MFSLRRFEVPRARCYARVQPGALNVGQAWISSNLQVPEKLLQFHVQMRALELAVEECQKS